MKKIRKLIFAATILTVITFAFPSMVSAAPPQDDRTVFGSSYTLESGRILDGNLNVFGGVVNIEEDAVVNGEMIVLGGVVNIDGTITGNLTVIGGTVTLEENAVIEGDLFAPASYISQDSMAVIRGNRVESWNIPWTNMDIPFTDQPRFRPTPQARMLSIITRIGRGTAMTLVLVALGALLLLVMPKSTETMTDALIAEPWQALGYGALTAFVILFGGTILTLTICLIPMVIVAALAFGLAALTGWLALGYELGKRLASSVFKTTWHPVLSAVVGNLVLYIVARGLELIPCLGPFIVLMAILFGMGMVVVTLFGTQPYPRGRSDNSDQQIVLTKAQETPVSEEDPDDAKSNPIIDQPDQ